jgi:hypothetical protein
MMRGGNDRLDRSARSCGGRDRRRARPGVCLCKALAAAGCSVAVVARSVAELAETMAAAESVKEGKLYPLQVSRF